jgi:hypothetical protein
MTRHDWAVVVVTFGPLCLAAAYIGLLRMEKILNEAYCREDARRDHTALSGAPFTREDMT